MPTTKESALEIADKLANVEANPGDGAIVAVLHFALRTAMYDHRELLGLSADDLTEIDNVGPQRRGGEPKPPAQ